MSRHFKQGPFPISHGTAVSAADRIEAAAVIYRVERWPDFVKDAEAIFPQHYEELALDRDKFPLDLSYSRYEKADVEGQILIVTARCAERLIGYFIALTVPHMHYESSGKMAYPDIYYVLPEFRRAGVGAKLLLALEIACKAIGIVKIYMSCKVHQDHSQLFELLGYKPSDLVFTKVL